jgi:hypothetical protein
VKPNNIRKLIRSHHKELSKRGEVYSKSEKTSKQGGRPATEYFLTEWQAVLICMFARTENAEDAREQIGDVYMAWRQGHLGPTPASVEEITREVLKQLGGIMKAVAGKDVGEVRPRLATSRPRSGTASSRESGGHTLIGI